MTNYLPDNASLENLKKQAKTLLKRVHDGDEETIAQIRSSHPQFSELDPKSLKLADSQLLLARYYGFNSWTELKRSLQPDDDVTNEFLRAAILRYGGSFEMDIEKAKRLLLENPTLAEVNIWTAATLGNAAAVERFLDEQPELVNKKGGFFDEAPLLYVCYSRAQFDDSSYDALATAKLLLERGADANAHYLTHGTYRFTCVTGAIGEGENGPVMCPPHPHATELVALLLQHGANPNDGQGLYDSMFTGGTHWIQLLLDHGLKQGHRINWAENDGVTTLDYLLAHAAKRNMIDRVELLLQHGADPNCIDWYDKKPVHQLALKNGNTRVVELLVEHGAKPIAPSSPKEAFYNACMAVDRETVDRMTSEHSEAKVRSWLGASKNHVALAAEANKPDAVRYLLELGFPIEQALFEAAWNGHLEIARILIENGALASKRNPDHGVTPIAYADRAGQKEVFNFLMEQEVDIFDAVRFGDIAKVEAVLAASPEAINERYRDYTSAKSDWSEHTPLLHAVVLGRDEIACWLLGAGADSTVKLRGQSVLEIASQNDCDQLVEALR